MGLAFDVATPAGSGRMVVEMPPREPRGVILLGHGAGGGIEAFDLAALAARLPPLGYVVARYEQPWRVAGRRVAGPPASLDRAWTPALAAIGERFAGIPLVVGGRSAGARVACRCFAGPAAAVVALSFPLHPPGKPEASRISELAAVPAPVLLISGDRDPFGSQGELADAVAAAQGGDRELVVVPGSAHSFRTQRAVDGRPETGALIATAVAEFLHRVL